ncbi:MAG TPA: kelch repeat-containing protein [Candidatus Limnocylindrales bacterium]
MVALVLLLILAGALGVLVAARLLERPSKVFGVFERAGDLPPLTNNERYIDTATVLADGRVLVTGTNAGIAPPDRWSFVYDVGTGTWAPTGRELDARDMSTATLLVDGRVLIVGGVHGDAEGQPVTPNEQLYDPATGTLQPTRGRLVTSRYNHTATLLADGRVLITGGSRQPIFNPFVVGDGADVIAAPPQLASAEIFDPGTGMFSEVGPMSEPREAHTATRLADGRVLITGGMTTRDSIPTDISTAAADVFDPASGTFTRVSSMRDSRTGHAATALADGRVLIVGGSTTTQDTHLTPLSSAELFDPSTGSFIATGSLATERSQPGALRLPDGRVLVVGGSNSYGEPRTAELFDPATGRFEAAGMSATPHGEAWAGTLSDGRVLVLGRVNDQLSAGTPELWSAFDRPQPAGVEHDPVGPGFAAIDAGAMPLRAGHTATLLADGRILLTGGTDAADPGADPRGWQPVASAEVFDPKTGLSRTVGEMSVRRFGHVAVPLPDGRVLVAGGEALACPPPDRVCVYPKPRAEIFDPATGRFTTLPAKLGPGPVRSSGDRPDRNWPPAAALLGDGRVLYIGPRRVAVIIDPATGEAQVGPPLRGAWLVSPVRLPDGRVVIVGGEEAGASIVDAAGRETRTIPGGEDWDGAITLADGRVLVVRETGAAALFDPASSSFTPTGSMADRNDPDTPPRFPAPYRRRLTLLADGRVLVTGGIETAPGGVPVADAELFDPSTGTFEAIGPMNDPRFGQSSTLLDDGRVVIIGGVVRSPDRTDPEPAVVEIFDPRKLP